MAHKRQNEKDRKDEKEGMERRERRERRDRRDEKKGMERHDRHERHDKHEKCYDHHNRTPRAHHKEDDRHLEDQKLHTDRQRGIDRVLQDARTDSLARGAQGGKMENGPEEHNWREHRDRLTPRGA